MVKYNAWAVCRASACRRGRNMKLIENKNFPYERDLYAVNGVHLRHCTFDGKEDGESALKEAGDIRLEDCFMNLRYPLWHCRNARLDGVTMTDKCRAALWYTENVEISSSHLLGIKALRECGNVRICDTHVVSPEFGWKSHGITITGSELESEYAFLEASDIKADSIRFKGKYSFQYTKNVVIENSVLDTKDAFWHSENVTVKNSVIKGEYLAWYSTDLTLIGCKIIGTQPLCYCKGLRLIDCETESADLSFEYSDVEATIKGNILSVKNPRSGHIRADSITELVYTADSKYKCECEIIQGSAV